MHAKTQSRKVDASTSSACFAPLLESNIAWTNNAMMVLGSGIFAICQIKGLARRLGLPGTAAYVYAGSTVPSLKQLAEEGVGKVVSWQLLLAFVILGLLPLVIKRVMTILPKRQAL